MTSVPFTPGKIFVSFWEHGTQKLQFLSYGPKHFAFNKETLAIANVEASLDPECTVELWLCSGIIEGLRQRDRIFSARYAAALAQYKGLSFFTLQQTPGHHCFIQPIPAQSPAEFKALVLGTLKPMEDPFRAWTAP
jgi:hypothetical protein